MSDLWNTDSGLTDEYVGTVDAAYFDYDPEYRDGEIPQLHLEFVNIDSEDTLPDGWTEKFSTGKNWEVVDNGSAVERTDGKDKGFHEKTRLGIFIDHLVDLGEEVLNELRERGNPTEAATFEGLRLRLVRHEEDYGEIDGERVKVEFMVPDEYLGAEEGASASTNGNGSSSGDREKLEKKLTAIAKTVDNHDEFVAKALDIDGVTDDDELFASVADDSDEGFFAQVA